MYDYSELSRIKKRALKILGNRNYSASEMERRLINKGESQEDSRDTVKWLEEIGAINDEDYAASIVRHYSAKGYGLAKIKEELHRRGIPREMWYEVLRDIDGTEEAAIEFLAKKLRGSRDKDDLRRATDALCRRGFSFDEAHTFVKKHLENTEETEETQE